MIYQYLHENAALILTVLLIPLAIRYIEKEYWSNLAKKRNVWNSFITKNKNIRNCFNKHANVEEITDIGSFTSSITWLILFIYLGFEIITLEKILNWIVTTNNLPEGQDIETVKMIIVFILSTPLFFFYRLMDNNLNGMNENNYQKKYSHIKILYGVCILFSGIQILFILVSLKEEIPAIMGLTIIASIAIATYSTRKSASSKLKYIINDIYPCVFG
ncbi:hypothetical protein [uncultured Methanolobus sp.]|uniref:hypothetical protein n=1 Tax=uncultured Methanolobus sp. TaxID=218300 RepID=UPI002AABB861|nr:hypothetical protein [uncultured Methanolobus sp.]